MPTILRAPSRRRDCCTITLTAEPICSRIARDGSSAPAMSTLVSKRLIQSRALFAWSAVSEPSWPRFLAWGGGGGAVVARVHGLEHVQCLATTTLADDDAIGAHT